MTDKLNLAIIGMGYWGNNFYRISKNLDHKFNLVAIVDTNSSLLNNYSDSGLNKFSDVNQLIESDIDFDCAIIATNSSNHYELAKVLFKNDIHCLIEKPITTNYQEAEELFDLAESNNKTLLVDHTFLYDSSILKLKEIIDSKELGNIIHLSFERTNLGPIRNDTNAAWDLTTHDISILFSLIDDIPKKVDATSMSFLNENIDDIVNISLTFDDIFVTLFSSWLHPEKSRVIKVVGDKKMAIWNGLLPDQELKIFDKGLEKNTELSNFPSNIYNVKSGKIEIPFFTKSEPLEQVVLDFYNKINGFNFNTINSKELTLNVTKLMEEINYKLIEK